LRRALRKIPSREWRSKRGRSQIRDQGSGTSTKKPHSRTSLGIGGRRPRLGESVPRTLLKVDMKKSKRRGRRIISLDPSRMGEYLLMEGENLRVKQLNFIGGALGNTFSKAPEKLQKGMLKSESYPNTNKKGRH